MTKKRITVIILLAIFALYFVFNNAFLMPQTLTKLVKMEEADLVITEVRVYEPPNGDKDYRVVKLSGEQKTQLFDMIFNGKYKKTNSYDNFSEDDVFYQIEMLNDKQNKWLYFEFYQTGLIDLAVIDRKTAFDWEVFVEIADDDFNVNQLIEILKR